MFDKPLYNTLTLRLFKYVRYLCLSVYKKTNKEHQERDIRAPDIEFYLLYTFPVKRQSKGERERES